MNGRFQIAIHILTLLDKGRGELLSSEYMAGSMNINPVIVRKEISNLRKAGFIDSKEGKNGGYTLAKDAAKISLADVYRALGSTEIIGRSRNTPNPDCPVGRDIQGYIEKLNQQLDQELLNRLGTMTLAQFSNQFE